MDGGLIVAGEHAAFALSRHPAGNHPVRDLRMCGIAAELLGGGMEQTYVRGRQGYVILHAVGQEALLIVLTTPDAKLGLVFLDVKRRVQELHRIL